MGDVSCGFSGEYFEDGFGSKLNLAKVSLFRFSSQLALPSGVETSKASVLSLFNWILPSQRFLPARKFSFLARFYVNPFFSNSLMRSIPRSVKRIKGLLSISLLKTYMTAAICFTRHGIVRLHSISKSCQLVGNKWIPSFSQIFKTFGSSCLGSQFDQHKRRGLAICLISFLT